MLRHIGRRYAVGAAVHSRLSPGNRRLTVEQVADSSLEMFMTVFQCPKCTLAFVSKNELEDHCRHDHENFHHEFRAAPPGPNDHLPVESHHPQAPAAKR